eukprot:3388387-Amphidinium_carterae.1
MAILLGAVTSKTSIPILRDGLLTYALHGCVCCILAAEGRTRPGASDARHAGRAGSCTSDHVMLCIVPPLRLALVMRCLAF